jgi:uncharacterized SAM-binding protein YcdF (DUF218 family)
MLTLTKAVGVLLIPPAVFLFLALAGLLLQYRWRNLGLAITAASVLALLFLSLPVTGNFLIRTLEDSVEPLTVTGEALQQRAGAIVVLGGGRTDAPEYGGDTVSGAALERLRYAARLHKLSRLPLLVAGGSVVGEPVAEAKLMHDALVQDFQVDVAWREERSRTTHENAVYTRPILDATGIQRVVLVTHAWHMPRAVLAFRQAGIDVIPAPTIYAARDSTVTVRGFLPSSVGLSQSNVALHEWLGMLWYRLAYGAPADPPGARHEPGKVTGGGDRRLSAFQRADGGGSSARRAGEIATIRIPSLDTKPVGAA